jgi:hypothetical protein
MACMVICVAIYFYIGRRHFYRTNAAGGYWFSLIVLQAFDFKLDRRDEPHLNSQYLPP